MSQENVAVVRSFLEAFAGAHVAAVYWTAKAVRD
jgi:hypothetical protein